MTGDCIVMLIKKHHGHLVVNLILLVLNLLLSAFNAFEHWPVCRSIIFFVLGLSVVLFLYVNGND